MSYSGEVFAPPWARWLMRPLGLVYFLLLGLVSCVILWEARFPGAMLAFIAAFWTVVIFGAVWIMRLLLRATLWRIYKRPMREFWRGLRPFILASAAIVLLAALLIFKVPARVAFLVSEPAMREVAQDILRRQAATPSPGRTNYPPRRVGVWRASEIWYAQENHTVTFLIDGAGFIDQEGWTYCVGPSPAPIGSTRYRHFTGPWYETVEQF